MKTAFEKLPILDTHNNLEIIGRPNWQFSREKEARGVEMIQKQVLQGFF